MAFDDNDNTSKLMEFLASEDAGTEWVSTGAIVSPNKAVPLDAYPNELVKKEAEQVQDAEVFAFDGSDLLPGALGTEWPTVLQGIMKNPSSLDSALDGLPEHRVRGVRAAIGLSSTAAPGTVVGAGTPRQRFPSSRGGPAGRRRSSSRPP